MWIAIIVAIFSAQEPAQAVVLEQTYASKQECKADVKTTLVKIEEELTRAKIKAQLKAFCEDVSH